MMAANRIIRDINTLSAENRQKFGKGCTVDQKFGGKIRSPARAAVTKYKVWLHGKSWTRGESENLAKLRFCCLLSNWLWAEKQREREGPWKENIKPDAIFVNISKSHIFLKTYTHTHTKWYHFYFGKNLAKEIPLPWCDKVQPMARKNKKEW